MSGMPTISKLVIKKQLSIYILVILSICSMIGLNIYRHKLNKDDAIISVYDYDIGNKQGKHVSVNITSYEATSQPFYFLIYDDHENVFVAKSKTLEAKVKENPDVLKGMDAIVEELNPAVIDTLKTEAKEIDATASATHKFIEAIQLNLDYAKSPYYDYITYGLYASGLILFLAILRFIIASLVTSLSTSKIGNQARAQIEAAFQEKQLVHIKGTTIYITDDYIIDVTKSCRIFPIHKILWVYVYPSGRLINGSKYAMCLGDDTGKLHTVCKVMASKKRAIYESSDLIARNHDHIIYGLDENQQEEYIRQTGGIKRTIF